MLASYNWKECQNDYFRGLTMLSSYDMKSFSQEVKKLRQSLGLTIDNVAALTGISLSAIKALEKGVAIPKFETLLILSNCYKVDLILVFNRHKDSKQIFTLYEKVNEHMTNGNKELIKHSLKDISLALLNEELNPVLIGDYLQLKYLFEGLEIVVNCIEEDSDCITKGLDKMIKALKVSIPGFKLDFYQGFKYSALEYRILFSIASLLGIQKKCLLSNDILASVLVFLNCYDYLEYCNSSLKAKAYALISYNYHRLDEHEKVIQYADMGISFCKGKDTTEYLPLLLARKSIALYNLEKSNWQVYYRQALSLLDIMGKEYLFKIYEEKFMHLVSLSNVPK